MLHVEVTSGRTKLTPASDKDVFQQLRLLSDCTDNVMDYVKGLLRASKDNRNEIQRNEF